MAAPYNHPNSLEQDPISKFKHRWDKAKENSSLNQPNAACLSTINSDGFPSGRFVDLKDITDDCFIFCTSLESKKAREISVNPHVALTFWWDHMGFQVRITGTATAASENASKEYWQKRSREARITTVCSSQSEPIDGIQKLENKIYHFKQDLSEGSVIPKPAGWGCFKVQPLQIEFLTFKESRLHLRELYELKDQKWKRSLLQP